MDIKIDGMLDSFTDGVKEVAETAHEKTSEFHDNYASKVIPDLGKYGDAAKFVAEMAPGVAEYNAIKDGDWTAFAIAAGIDVAAVAAGAFSLGTGYAAVKSGSVAAKVGVKVAVKEVAEAGAKKAAKEITEAGTEKVVKEVAEAGAKKAAKEIAETGTEKVVKEVAEAGAKKATKEIAEAGAEKTVKEVAEAGAKKTAKEITEEITEQVAKETTETGTEKIVKETTKEVSEKLDKAAQIVKNKMDGIAREEKVLEDLISKHGKDNVLREQYIRDKAGDIIKDLETGTGRRIDFLVKQGEKIIDSIEVTNKGVDKTLQLAKESRILQLARENGGAFIKDFNTGELLEFADDVVTVVKEITL